MCYIYCFKYVHFLSKFKESSHLFWWAGNEHVDPGLILGVSWPGLGAEVLGRSGTRVVDQTLVHHVGDAPRSRQQQHLTVDRP